MAWLDGITTVTQGKWSVSDTSGTNIDGVILNVAILHDNLRNRYGGLGKFQYGDHNGKRFATKEEASRFALEHGYTRRYYTAPDLRARKVKQARDPRKPWTP